MINTTKYSETAAFEFNPFKPEGIKSVIRTAKENEREMVDAQTGEYLFVTSAGKTKEVLHDPAMYTKVFKTSISMYELSIPANNLFHYICQTLTRMQTSIYIDCKDFLKEFNYKPKSKKLYYQAITELIERNIISKRAKQTSCYWINMNIIFNGDRTKLVSTEECK